MTLYPIEGFSLLEMFFKDIVQPIKRGVTIAFLDTLKGILFCFKF
jgi:hypothetical protein